MNARRRHPTLAVLLLTMACASTPPTAPDAAVVPPIAPGAPTSTITSSRSGTFSGLAGHQASGTVRLVVRDTIATVEFGPDFQSSGVPGPFVYLNTTTDANRGSPLRIAALKSTSGAQSYDFRLPSGVTYTHVLVWCDPYNVGVGAAALAP